jgi:hypothetical protein
MKYTPFSANTAVDGVAAFEYPLDWVTACMKKK